MSGTGGALSIGSVADKLGLTSLTGHREKERDGPKAKEGDEGEWEEVEIGKGLALYNSTEMGLLKGQKR